MLRKALSRKPRKAKSIIPKKDPILPAVKRVELIFELDELFLRDCLKRHSLKGVEGIKWPEAIKALHKKYERAENKLLHLRSCIDRALSENISPIKERLSDIIVIRSYTQK